MAIHKKRAGRVLLEFLTIMLIGLTPVASGLLIIALQVDRKHLEAAEKAAHEALDRIESVIETLHTTSSKVLSLAELACDKAMPKLRVEVVSEPNLRSLVLLRENRAYCSTQHGESEIIVDPGTFHNQKLLLAAGNQVTPDSPVLYYRLQEYPFGVLALTNGLLLQQMISAIKEPATVVVQFGTEYLSATDIVEDISHTDINEQYLHVVSHKHGFIVHSGFADGSTWQEVRSNMLASAPSLLLVGIITSAFVYWSLFSRRNRKP